IRLRWSKRSCWHSASSRKDRSTTERELRSSTVYFMPVFRTSANLPSACDLWQTRTVMRGRRIAMYCCVRMSLFMLSDGFVTGCQIASQGIINNRAPILALRSRLRSLSRQIVEYLALHALHLSAVATGDERKLLWAARQPKAGQKAEKIINSLFGHC